MRKVTFVLQAVDLLLVFQMAGSESALSESSEQASIWSKPTKQLSSGLLNLQLVSFARLRNYLTFSILKIRFKEIELNFFIIDFCSGFRDFQKIYIRRFTDGEYYTEWPYSETFLFIDIENCILSNFLHLTNSVSLKM